MIAHYRIARPIPDNDENYFSLLEGVLSSIDSLCQMDVQKGFEAYHFRILPSDGRLVDSVVQELITLHNMLGIHMEMSKSIKNMGVISFQIKINQ